MVLKMESAPVSEWKEDSYKELELRLLEKAPLEQLLRAAASCAGRVIPLFPTTLAPGDGAADRLVTSTPGLTRSFPSEQSALAAQWRETQPSSARHDGVRRRGDSGTQRYPGRFAAAG